MTKKNIIGIALIFMSFIVFSQGDDSTKNKKTEPPVTNNNYQVSIDPEVLSQLTEIIKPKPIPEKSPWEKYGVLIVAIVALLGTIGTTLIGTKVSKDNLTKQLNAAEKNLLAQINATKSLEKEKKELDQQHEKLNELKELIAHFIQKSTLLNLKLNSIIYYHLEEGRDIQAQGEYYNTALLRNELKSAYYSIKVTLDGSSKQKELETVIDKYMNATCFKFELNSLQADDYEQPISKLYHKIKAVIHDNYNEPT